MIAHKKTWSRTRRTLAVAVVVLPAVAVLGPGSALGQSWRTTTISRQISGEDSLNVEIRYGAGRFTIRPIDEGMLYRMTLRYDEDTFEPVAEYEGHHVTLGVRSLGSSVKLRGRHSDGRMELALGKRVPMDLDLKFGAVRGDIDLGGLSLTGLRLSTGASEARLDVSEPNPGRMRRASFEVGAADFKALHLGNLNADRIDVDAGVGSVELWFTGSWRNETSVSIDMGLGSLTLRFPEGLGVRIKKSGFLASLDSQGLVKRGSAYYSLDWDDASRRVSIDLNAAFGSVSIEWVH